jgi:hypothetical protein
VCEEEWLRQLQNARFQVSADENSGPWGCETELLVFPHVTKESSASIYNGRGIQEAVKHWSAEQKL